MQNTSSANSRLCQNKWVEDAQLSVQAALSVPKYLLKFCTWVVLL